MAETRTEGLALRLAKKLVFGARPLVLALFALGTVVMGYYAFQLSVDAGFKKQLPLQHEYMQTFQFYEEFGGGNRLLVALMARDGDILDAEYFKALEEITNRVFFIPGVERSSVRSIFTPNVRYVEVVEDGFAGGNVIPADFEPTEEMFEQVRSNIVKSGEIGRLVTEDFDGAMVWANLLERNPETGEKIDYQRVASELEKIREDFENERHSVHIIGFAKIVGDVAEGAQTVVWFFAVAFAITLLLLWLHSRAVKLAAMPLLCAAVAVIWGLGALRLMGFGIDPMNILTPFLIFAIGVSHGVQMVSAWIAEKFFEGHTFEQVFKDGRALQSLKLQSSLSAAGNAFGRLLAPGLIALLSDTIGFLTILLIDIRIIQELAITASVGVAVIILTNLVLLPVLLSYTRVKDAESYREGAFNRANAAAQKWRVFQPLTTGRGSATVIIVAAALLGVGIWKSQDVYVGDARAGVPELRENARYNRDARLISREFALGVDTIGVIAETRPQSCTEDYEVMRRIDEFAWQLRNVDGVQKVLTLPMVAKIVNAGWQEGNLRWRVLPRNKYLLRQALANVDTDTGLRNRDCSGIPILIFTEDHRAQTINRVVKRVKELRREYNLIPPSTDDRAGPELRGPVVEKNSVAVEGNICQDAKSSCVRFRLATGNVGVMAATNEVVAAAQVPILMWVFAAIVVLCLITFRSIAATLAIVIPLAIVSYLAYALMAVAGIGLKVNTLPVVALGVGIGVDYGIYIFSRLQTLLRQGIPLDQAYFRTLRLTGRAVIFTAMTLAVGVGTWLFSPLKFQADMGLLLAFFFILNMVGAIVLLPALCRWLLPKKLREGNAG